MSKDTDNDIMIDLGSVHDAGLDLYDSMDTVYTTSITGASYPYTTDTITISTTDTFDWDDLTVDTGSNYRGSVKVDSGKGEWDLEERLKTIERALNIPERDYDMEAKHPELTELFEKHLRKIERVLKKLPSVSEYEREVEKRRMWDVLKGPDRNVDGGL